MMPGCLSLHTSGIRLNRKPEGERHRGGEDGNRPGYHKVGIPKLFQPEVIGSSIPLVTEYPEPRVVSSACNQVVHGMTLSHVPDPETPITLQLEVSSVAWCRRDQTRPR